LARSDWRRCATSGSRLDSMMAQAASAFDAAQRARIYAKIAQYITSQAYAPLLVATAPVAVTAKGYTVRG
jgi:ABC-type transport system substrate-binding protein